MKTTGRTFSTATLTVLTGLSALGGVSAITLLGSAGAEASVTTTPNVDTSSRAGALAAYQNMYLPALAVASGSTGSTSSCTPGTTTGAAQQAALAIVDYDRSMAKLAPATLNSSWTTGAQASALIQAANGSLNHTPATSAKCYTPLGATTSARSNLAAGSSTSGTTVTPYTPGVLAAQYADDSGNNNAAMLGHRRWVLDPGLTQVGVGQVGSYQAMQVNNGAPLSTPSGSPAYVAWPSAGYVPKALVPTENTWSLSASDATVDMSSTTVAVKSGTTNVPVTVTHLPDGAGKPTVEFKPSTAYTGGADRSFTVTVSGMKKGSTVLAPYTYTTTLFDETKTDSTGTTSAPLKTNTVTWNPTTTVKVGQIVPRNPSAASGSGSFQYNASMTGPDVCSFNGSGGITFGAAGTCTVTVTAPAANGYTAATLTRTFTVS